MIFKNYVKLKKLNTDNVRQSLKNKGYNDVDLCMEYMSGFKKIGQHFKSDLRIEIDKSKIEALKQVNADLSNRIVTEFNAGLRGVEEARDLLPE